MVKVLFFGTPEIAVPFLETLCASEQVVGVVCRPDEPAGRGYALTPPPTKVFAMRKNIPVFQPQGPWQPDFVETLKSSGADVGIIVAYGRILPETVFKAPRLGCINLHFSLLPKYRGAAPMQWSLINGEKTTGVTAFWLDAGLDSGDICKQLPVSIADDDNLPSLRTKLIAAGQTVLGQVMSDVKADRVVREPQKGEASTAPQLSKETGRVDWRKPAASIVNLIRGVYEWPGASTKFSPEGGPPKNLKLLKARVAGKAPGKAAPGEIVEVLKNEGFCVKAGDEAVVLLDVQPEGKKPMSAWSFWQGARLKVGEKLG